MALVEKDRVGGTCLNVGCIPTKALTTATNLLVDARRSEDFGLTIPEVKPDLPALMAYERETVDNLVGGVERLLGEREVTLVRGRGRLTAPDTLQVAAPDGRTIVVDEYLQTSVPHVWPIGDAVDGPWLAHKAMVDGRVAAENATGGERSVDYGSVPNVIFTRPEVASVGLTRDEARERGVGVK